MLLLPRQLKKVEQYKQTVVRKKSSVEALLKAGVQNHLVEARIGLNQLNVCLQDVKDVQMCLQSIHNLFADASNLCYNKLNEVRDESVRHSQYVTAKGNLKHIFTISESIQQTKQWINEGKLLHVHQCLRELENSRDDLLFELHKLPNQSAHDRAMVKAYFANVEALSELLEKQLRLVLARTLNTVCREPAAIVTALRIIEREEKADEETRRHEKQTGFLPPGRPKCWKVMAFEVLERAVATRIEGTQVERREDSKLWLVRRLELMRQLILEDLRVVICLCVPCFPPSYNIISRFVLMYHACLSKHLQEIIHSGLEGNEYISVLSWISNTYKGEELMGHPDLKEHTASLNFLVSTTVIKNLQDQYIKNVEKNYTKWMQNLLRLEKQEWFSSNFPEETCVDKCLHSAAPTIIFQMIHQNLQVTKTVSQELTNNVLTLSVEQVIKFGQVYKEAIIEFKNTHFEDRSQVSFFTQHMITIVNNCLQLAELGSQLEKQYLTYGLPQHLADGFRRLEETYIQLRNESGQYLLEEVFLDLDTHFEELFASARWLQTSLPVDTICATLEDYFQDYSCLVEANLKYIIREAQKLITKRYITEMLSKKVTFKSHADCHVAAGKIFKEVGELRRVFVSSVPSTVDTNDPLNIIIMLTEVLKCKHDMISFNLYRIVEEYSDITEDHLLRLLNLRGDLARADLKEKVGFVTKSVKPKIPLQPTIFSQLVLPD